VLERLNDRYRRAIELRFLEELSRESCAAALDVKLGTFDVLLLRALRAFRKDWDAVLEREALHDAG
jgi:RNA polymerase sigma-70 factor (ECF subfamily)